jgi:uncharacterized protein (TIGR03089 family)
MALLADALRRDGARPLITFYDDSTGERVELSVATTANWVAKTANFLIDEHDIEPGDAVGVDLPLHWQSAVVMLAAWAVGAVVALDGAGDLAFTTTATTGSAGAGTETIVLSLAPMGADFSRLVAAYGDVFVATDAAGADVVDAAPTDLPAGARVLSTVSLAEPQGLGYGLVAPLAADGSVVYVVNPDPAAIGRRADAERVTHTLGISLDGLPQL